METTQEERNMAQGGFAFGNTVRRLANDADRLARTEAVCLLRSEIDAPEDAIAWHKKHCGACSWKMDEGGIPKAPDFLPNESGPITLPILEA